MRAWRRFRADMAGNMAVLFAMGFAVSAMVSALAVDAASLYHERRMLQNGVDLAALSAAGDPGRAASLAQASLVEAGLLPAGTTAGLQVVTGHYDPDPALPVAQRFTPGRTPLNAVEVQMARRGVLHFANGWAEPPMLHASALASVTPQVSFSVGSRLASLNGGIANSVLDRLLGTSVNIAIADYRALLHTRVDALGFLDALASRLGVTVGSYDDLLGLEADHGVLAAALADLLTGVERGAMQRIAAAAGNNGKVSLGKLFQLGELGRLAIGSGGEDLFTDISALDLLGAGAALGNGTNQVSLGLTVSVPGLTGITADLAVGEPPQGGGWYAVGPTGMVLRTAQVRLRLISTLKLSLLLLPLLEVRLPLYLDVAHAEAMVASAACPTPSSPRGAATILARPGIARLILGEVSAANLGAFGSAPRIDPAVLVNMLGIKVTGAAHADIAQSAPVTLSFSSADIASGTVRTAKTTTPVGSLVGSLLGDLTLTAAGIPLGIIGPALEALLAPLAPALDLTITRLLEALGLALGEADVTVYGVRCGNPVLVG